MKKSLNAIVLFPLYSWTPLIRHVGISNVYFYFYPIFEEHIIDTVISISVITMQVLEHD